MSSQINFKLNGKSVEPPKEWLDLEILSTFDNGNTQANVSINNFTFPNQLRTQIQDWINGGINGQSPGIFEGMDFEISVTDELEGFQAFKGQLELDNDLTILSPVETTANILEGDSLNTLDTRLQSLTVGYLESIGVFTNSDYTDVEYVVEKKFDAIEFIITSITIYLMTKEIVESIERIATEIGNIQDAATPVGAPPVPNIGQIVYTGILIALNIAYTIAMILAIKKLMDSILNQILSPVRKHKGIALRILLTKIFSHLGYNLISPIPELDGYVYLPSKPYQSQPIQKGLPKESDFGYRCSESIELVLSLFKARLAIEGDNIHLRTLSDKWWVKNSTYKFPDVLLETYKYNTDEMVAGRIVSFQTDIADDWTIDNFKGTSYVITTTPNTFQNYKNILLKGFEEFPYQLALGTRKDKLTSLERLLGELGGTVDTVINALGGSSNFKSRIKSRVGMLKVSQEYHQVPKLLLLVGGRMPSNNRDLLSAKYLWNKYLNYDSFVDNNFQRQRLIYEGVRIPFSFSNFLKTNKNSYFTLQDGRVGKFTKLSWRMEGDFATADFWIENIYTKNLRETKVEPQ